MLNFLKNILKSDTTVTVPAGPVAPLAPVISFDETITNDSCETTYLGTFIVPEGTTARVTGTLVRGYAGTGYIGSAFIPMIQGTVNRNPGTYQYVVSLGNSGISGQSSLYTLTVTLNNGVSRNIGFERSSAESVFYDIGPC